MSKHDGNVHTIPLDGTDHVEAASCWCQPTLADDFTDEGGRKHYLHREKQ